MSDLQLGGRRRLRVEDVLDDAVAPAMRMGMNCFSDDSWIRVAMWASQGDVIWRLCYEKVLMCKNETKGLYIAELTASPLLM